MSEHAPPYQIESNDQDLESLTDLLSHQQRSINSTSHVAIVGASACPIESLDYEIAENDLFKQDWRTRGKIFQYIFMKWLLCFLIGGFVSLVGFFKNLAVENIAGVKDRRDLVTCGSAAAIAAAIRAPLGGVLFALEEMLSWWRSSLLWRAFFRTAVVAIILRALIDVCYSGKCGLFGKGGSLYNFLLTKVLRVYNFIYEEGIIYQIFIACTISICTSSLLFGLPWLASCQPCPSDAPEACPTIGRSGNYKRFHCPPGHYNDAVKNPSSKNSDAEFHLSTMLIFFITCFILNIFSYGIVAPADLFVPAIVTGASYGRFIAMLLGSHTNLGHGLYAVLGAASFLGFPYLETHAEPYMRQLTVADVVSCPLRLFHGIEKDGNIVHILKTTRHHGFPVIDASPGSESPVLCGLILCAHLIALLKKKAFLSTPIRLGVDDAFRHFSADDFAKKGLGNVDKIEDIELTDEEMEMFLDLHPFTNASPYTVVETMSLAKALTLFREVVCDTYSSYPRSPAYETLSIFMS
ncbi:putative chloride channel-like protein CLC-g [Hibiscus syriacus]|uniref:Chloride channel-like protein CLC-g n=1 Tax=Hibiscus syriacus TaxID=106335 RepID=A0A6A2ZDA3_HIBSY|nr:putative chloride channel-like protein CLC-g [Hibiscus syriacus]